ncbi:MAG: biotin--[acetyl-CoA-carboxylase] ligase [Planctomycetota bacterium]|nr:biotin--[acetyl-CoA-carboxylase] ligase [Planctomycetota bacterium]
MRAANDHLAWPDRLEELIEHLDGFDRVVVLSETDSTQDAARRESSPRGSVILAGRQIAGRGRQGRVWDDAQGDGVALTMVVPREDSAFLCARAGVAVARSLVPWLEAIRVHAGLKWPNDLIMISNGLKKFAGILVEGHADTALIGIGVNVHTRTWAEGLIGSACSLEEAGLEVSRLEVIERILLEWDSVCSMSREELGFAYTRYDLLTGATALVDTGGRRLQGVIRSVDPFEGIELDTPSGICSIDPATAHVIEWQLPDALK